MSERRDEDLLRLAQTGDSTALAELLERYESTLFRFGMRMCGNREDAQDVLQESLIALARSVRSVEGTARLSTWLYTVARNQCIRQRRRAHASVTDSLDTTPHAREALAATHASDRSVEDVAASREVVAQLERALATLTNEYREVLLLRDGEGLSAAEVATVVGASVDAVKSRLHRARLTLRDAFMREAKRQPSPRIDKAVCPDVVQMFSEHLEGDVDAAACARMEKHLSTCASCAETCVEMRNTVALCKSAPGTPISDDVRAAVRATVAKVIRNTEA